MIGGLWFGNVQNRAGCDGGDNAPQAIVEGAKLALAEFADIAVQLYGPEDVLRPMTEGVERLEIVHAPDVIGMHDSPMLAVRQKTESSLVKAVMAVRRRRCGRGGFRRLYGRVAGRRHAAHRPHPRH